MKGKRVFITGGASGLGRALAERYLRAGWRVAIGDLDRTKGRKAIEALGGGEFVRCDVTRDEDLEGTAARLEKRWGGVDVVVNNAGVAVSGGIAETPLDDWRWIVDVNLLGVVRGCRAFTPVFRRGGGGRFVNISSMAGLVHPPMMSAYAATKAAVVALSESLRLELAADGIGVTVVCPAFFRTSLAETARSTTPEMALVTRALVTRARATAPEIAEIAFRGAEKGEFLVLTHREGMAAWALKRALPFPLYAFLLGASSRKMLRPRRRARPGGGA